MFLLSPQPLGAKTLRVNIVLPLVHKTSNTLLHVTFLPKTEKTTQALSVHRTGTFCIYIECLLVICLKVTTIKEERKKGQSLEYWFEQTMESEDASDEEASHCNPPKMDLTNNQYLEVISMFNRTPAQKRFHYGCH